MKYYFSKLLLAFKAIYKLGEGGLLFFKKLQILGNEIKNGS